MFILSAVAGWVDTAGLEIFLDERSSFMSGRGAALGYWAHQGDHRAFLNVILVVLAFIFGAYLATLLVDRKNFAAGLYFSASLLLLGSFFLEGEPRFGLEALLLPMAMGGQNASTSLTPLNRTTHLTGPSTDIGMQLARKNYEKAFFWAVRWLGFPLGACLVLGVTDGIRAGSVKASLALQIPAAVLILMGLLQRSVFKIPRLERTA